MLYDSDERFTNVLCYTKAVILGIRISTFGMCALVELVLVLVLNDTLKWLHLMIISNHGDFSTEITHIS